jgi:hypothetical protein
MTALALLLILAQPASQLPPEIVQSLLKAAERVAAIAQSGVLCQAQVSAEQARLSTIQKERVEAQNKIAGLEKDIDLAQLEQRGKSSTSDDYRTAQAAITHARALIANTKKHLSDIAGDERESTARLGKHEACVAAAHTQLDKLKASR